MHADDLILVSVDDHLVEPPDLFDGHIPAQVTRPGARGSCARHDGSDVWVFDGPKIPNIGLNAVAGRPKEEYGIEPTAFDEMRPGCWDIDERIKDMNAGGVLGSMCFPSFPGFSRPAVRRRRRQGPRPRRRCRPTTTGTSTSGAAPTPAASSRWACPCCGTRSWPPTRCAALAAKGVHSVTFTENPATLGYPTLPQRLTGTRCGRRCCDDGRRRVDPPRLVGPAGGHRPRRPDRRDDHAAADEHLPGRRRPAVVAASSSSSPTSASRCPRAAPAGSPTSSTGSTAPTTCTTCGPARTSATSCRARCSASTSSPASSPTRSASQLRAR